MGRIWLDRTHPTPPHCHRRPPHRRPPLHHRHSMSAQRMTRAAPSAALTPALWTHPGKTSTNADNTCTDAHHTPDSLVERHKSLHKSKCTSAHTAQFTGTAHSQRFGVATSATLPQAWHKIDPRNCCHAVHLCCQHKSIPCNTCSATQTL